MEENNNVNENNENVKEVNSTEQVVENNQSNQNENGNANQSVNQTNKNTSGDNSEKAPVILRVISFFIPLVGLIIYLCSYNDNRKYGNSCGIPALVGFILRIVLISLIIFIFIIVLGVFLYNSPSYDYNYNFVHPPIKYYYERYEVDDKYKGLDT